ncbi:hypothetical protein [Roseospira navarrensis]|uniref:Phage late control D family protein n=1 Tax=Roseospira navarrensis TaxID=140058 RepID=A0A7X1ZFL8_9PROT|nr:hypothetical protein [Roseospira navarrensis]MQX37649.1 hypothetical protein [Roseospira navarrensis]
MPDIRYQIAVNKAPDNALSAEVSEIEVTQTMEGPTTGRVRFAVDICGADMSLVNDARLTPRQPDTEISVIAVLGGTQHVILHGVITERQANLTEGGPGSYLELKLTDRRAVMDRKPHNRAHSGSASDIVSGILGTYGFEPDIVNTPIDYDEDTNTLNQTESDLAFVDKLAGRTGSRFWLDWTASTGLTGFEIVETAHFKPSPPRPASNPLGFAPPIKLAPTKAPTLTLNAGDGCSNLASFEVASNAEAPNQSGLVQRVGADSPEVDETEVPEPSDPPLGADPPPTQARVRRVVSAGNAQEAHLRNQAALNDAAYSIKATAETSVQALNGVLAAHQIVTVAGAGSLNSGDYVLSSVTHTIDPSGHKMRLEMLRNAAGAAS